MPRYVLEGLVDGTMSQDRQKLTFSTGDDEKARRFTNAFIQTQKNNDRVWSEVVLYRFVPVSL